MKYIRLPLKDYSEDDYCYELFQAAKELNKIVFTNSNIYMHCSSGLTRGPTLALVFLCLFKRIEQWKVVYSAMKFLQNFKNDI